MELSRLRISEKKQAVLHTMNVHCVEDLLTYYPFRYETLTVVPREQWQKDMKIVIEATIVTKARVIRFRGSKALQISRLYIKMRSFRYLFSIGRG
ncbi:hypothetical protein [Amedibacillus dolichus]|uniref:hypothetical protein n=1 Tax=Amedibacillus dolichus TaxID=31971 RepID=UPI002175608B|nr:hypothetical protein [Amedibacillus dolichus]